MTHPTLPPRGIFVPTQIIFHPELSATVLVTWIKLRCLAWDGWDTPPMNLPQLAALLGVHPARLNRHLDQLQELCALFIRTASQDRIILSFPEEPSFFTEPLVIAHEDIGAVASQPKKQDPGASAAYFPARIMGYISYDDEESLMEEGIQSAPVKDQARLTPCAHRESVFIAK